jgi:hypothetical protein
LASLETEGLTVTETLTIQKPNCPRCQGKRVIKNGHDKFGRQLFRCRDCHREWTEGSTSEGIEDPEPILPFLDSTSLLKHFNRKPLNVDSVYDVPCFCCPFNERIGSCDPSTCEKFDKWCLSQNA